MTDRRYVSPGHVAAALGVGTTTVKRWVDEGTLPAQRTAGGHRRILVADVLRVVREGNFPRLDVSRLGLPRRGEPAPETGELAELLLAALEQGDGPKARLLLLEAHRGGLIMEELVDAVIAPAMARIGQGWQEGRLDVLHEHRASQICAAALHVLEAELEQAARAGGPVAIGGGPEGDPYQLATLSAKLVLLEAGWEAINLGPNTPIASFRRALAEFRPRLLWLSVGALERPEAFVREYRQLYQDAERRGAAVAIGGRALTEDVRAGLPYTTYGDRMSHLAAFARSLQPQARRRTHARSAES